MHKEHAVYLVVSGVLAIGHQGAGISLLLYKSSDDNQRLWFAKEKRHLNRKTISTQNWDAASTVQLAAAEQQKTGRHVV